VAGTGGDDDDLIADINVTPLVDVVLVLLIIFMVTATYIVRASIEVDLPRAAHGGEAVGTVLSVVLTKDGQVFLDGVQRTSSSRARATRSPATWRPASSSPPTAAPSTGRWCGSSTSSAARA
jgi:biopolymer transport protein ExbD